MADPIRAALERLVELDGLPDSWSPAGIQAWDDAIAAGKAALAEQQGEGPSDNEVTQLLFDNFRGPIEFICDDEEVAHVMIRSHIKFARAVLARWGHQPARLRNCPTHGQQPPEAWGCPECVRELREELAAARLHQPTPPAEGEVAELVEWLHDCADVRMDEGYEEPAFKFARAAELLQQQHPTPVPVSERLPGPEDCDAEGRCWAWDWLAEQWCLCDREVEE